ncbi:MAG: hypothetical protein IKZ55_11825 [Bacteroidales bacterium]|nr:hypothetical protein [Bacteroidales bacterium]
MHLADTDSPDSVWPPIVVLDFTSTTMTSGSGFSKVFRYTKCIAFLNCFWMASDAA